MSDKEAIKWRSVSIFNNISLDKNFLPCSLMPKSIRWFLTHQVTISKLLYHCEGDNILF